MKLKLVFTSLLLAMNCEGQESWLCTEDSTQVRSDSVLACGIGQAQTEGDARRLAFKSARAEFDQVCGPNTECSTHRYSVEPQRSSCGRIDGQWKCYRLVQFKMKSEPKRTVSPNSIIASQCSGNLKTDNDELTDRLINKALREALKD